MNITTTDTAGLTSEATVAAIGNRYEAILVAARRMRELGRGDRPKVTSAVKHSAAVTAMLEIEAGLVTRNYLFKDIDPEPRRRHRDHERF